MFNKRDDSTYDGSMLKKSRSKRKLFAIIGGIIMGVALLGLMLPQIQITKAPQKTLITIGWASAGATGSTDYSFTGSNDSTPFQAALDALPATGGEILVVTPAVGFTTINFSGTVTRAIDNVTICGSGNGTSIVYNGGSPIFTAGGNGWSFQNLKVDAGSIDMGATTGWIWNNVNVDGTLYTERSPNSSLIDNALSLPTNGTANYVIAASNSSATDKAHANYIMPSSSADLGAVINAEITALSAVGGVIHLDAGSFAESTGVSTVQSNITIEGAGQSLTSISLANGSNCSMLTFGNGLTSGCSFITLKEFTLYGNATNQTSGSGIYLNSVYTTFIDHVTINQMHDQGIHYSGTVTQQSSVLLLSNSCIYNSGLYGVFCDYTAYGMQASNCYIGGNGKGAQYAGMGFNSASDELISNCIFDANCYGARVYSSARITFTGCEFDDQEQHCIIVDGSSINVAVSNCLFYEWGITAPSTYSAFITDGKYNTFSNNILLGQVFTTNYAIHEVTGADYNTYIGNSITQCTSGSVIVGTHSIFQRNSGVNPVGKIANPIGTSSIGLNGTGTTVTSATVYTVSGVDCFITSTGGTVSNIVIKDAGGNVMETGATTLTNQYVPIGYSVTWTHAGAPTVTVFGN